MGVNIQINPDENRKLIKKKSKVEQNHVYWIFLSLFCENRSDQINFRMLFLKLNQTKPNHIYKI